MEPAKKLSNDEENDNTVYEELIEYSCDGVYPNGARKAEKGVIEKDLKNSTSYWKGVLHYVDNNRQDKKK